MATANVGQKKGNNKKRDGPELLTLDSTLVSVTELASVDARPVRISQENHESTVFIWFDPEGKPIIYFGGALRAINDNLIIFSDATTCINTIKLSQQKIFFITSSSSTDLLITVQKLPAVEGIFILDPNISNVKGDFSKLCGIFTQQEELFRVLKEILDLYEHIQLEEFVFEEDKEFLWSQLWKRDLTSRKGPIKKEIFVSAARKCYRDNPVILREIDELEKTYRSSEAIIWCLRSPFPYRFLHHAIRAHNKDQLRVCRSIFIDVFHTFEQHPQHRTTDQFYRGMKLSNEIINKFEAHIGQMVSTSGFFPSIRSRSNALALASLPAYRPDLLPVLFKIDCDQLSVYIDLTNKYPTPLLAFELCSAFRIVYVNRGAITVIRLKTDRDSGRRLASRYLDQHPDVTIQSLLDELITPPKPPTPPPPPPPPPKSERQPKSSSNPVSSISDPPVTAEEIKAQRLVVKGDVDRALDVYQRIQPPNPRVLNTMGQIFAERKGDFNNAVDCHRRALKIQEENNEDCADTLTDLGNAYHHCDQYDLALGCHRHALGVRQSKASPDEASIATNLVGIANVHWARQEYPEAIDNAQRALIIRQSLVPLNEASLAATFAMLGNIYQDSGNSALALDLTQKALSLFEKTLSRDSLIVGELLLSMGTMQISIEAFEDACRSFARAVKTYKRFLPETHPDRLAAESEYERAVQLFEKKKKFAEKQSQT